MYFIRQVKLLQVTSIDSLSNRVKKRYYNWNKKINDEFLLIFKDAYVNRESNFPWGANLSVNINKPRR